MIGQSTTAAKSSKTNEANQRSLIPGCVLLLYKYGH